MIRNHTKRLCNIEHLTREREVKDSISRAVQERLQVTEYFVRRLGLETELEGHRGCVNCLEWNESGSILASASDDLHVILWDPFSHKKISKIQTGHHGNIFSVKFLPNSNDGVLVTGAGDCRILVNDVTLGETTHVCCCHTGRVKRLATAPYVPYMFWSAAEDGTVMQFDLRAPHTCGRDMNNVVVNLLNHLGRYAEAKCLAINPRRPELLAVGANDPYIRVYDRRMIKLTCIQYPSDHVPRSTWERQSYMASNAGEGDLEENIPNGAVMYFAGGHLPLKHIDYKKKYRNLASTYVTFSDDGNELLANLGGEQIYLFDINNRRKPLKYDINFLKVENGVKACIRHSATANGFRNGTNGFASNSSGAGISRTSNGVRQLLQSLPSPDKAEPDKCTLPPYVQDLKYIANTEFEKSNFTVAIAVYNKAISLCPNAAVLYANRAAALMKRGWDGDTYAAMRDCHTALQLDPNHMKAHFRLARCLYELQWVKEATECLQLFKAKFPDHIHSHACQTLTSEIEKANLEKSSDSTSDERMNVPAEMETEDDGTSASGDPESNSSSSVSPISDQERAWRETAYDYEIRFCGHCNTTTDIKEANFFGRQGQFVVAGSDDGSFFIWDRNTTNIVRVLRGDDSIVNCLQPHPESCLLATSGIDPVVRLWSPRPEDGSRNDRVVEDLENVASANQKRMNADPFEVMLMNMGYRITSVQEEGEGSDDSGEAAAAINCRAS